MSGTSVDAAPALSAEVAYRLIGVEADADKNFAEEEHRTGMGDDKRMVAAYPSESGFDGPIAFEHRGTVDETTIADGIVVGCRGGHLCITVAVCCACRAADPWLIRNHRPSEFIGKERHLLLHDVVIVFAKGIGGKIVVVGHVTGDLLFRSIVESQTDDALRSRDEQGRVEAFLEVVAHIFHCGIVFSATHVRTCCWVAASAGPACAMPQAKKPRRLASDFIDSSRVADPLKSCAVVLLVSLCGMWNIVIVQTEEMPLSNGGTSNKGHDAAIIILL